MFDKKDFNRPFILELLTKYPKVEINFKKIDGSVRTLHGTLMASEVSVNHQKALSRVYTQQENLNIIPVWDVIAGGWRSFRLENIISIEEPEEMKQEMKQEKKKSE